MMRTMVTSARMFFAVDEIRKLAGCGHTVLAADTFRSSPGRHSRDVTERLLVPPPASEPLAFVGAVRDLARANNVDMVLPQFEEVFYLARHRDEVALDAQPFFSEFDVLAKLHDKASFASLVGELGLKVAPSLTARTAEELHEAVSQFDHYFARAAYSRGGVELLTNTGPLAGEVDIGSVRPTATNPWVVQPFITGTDVCSYSIAHHGRITGHAAYEHPKTFDHGGGIEFLSVDAPETLDASRTIIEATGFHGQVSFDFMRDEQGAYWLVECNARPTAGVVLLTQEEFGIALAGDNPNPVIAAAGRYQQLRLALLRDMVLDWREIPSDAHDFFAAPGVYSEDDDPRPLLYALLSYAHVHQYRRALDLGKHSRKDVMEAQFYDIAWNGEPIP